MQGDIHGAYDDFLALAHKGYRPEETWYRCGMISQFLGEKARAKEELTRSAPAYQRPYQEPEVVPWEELPLP